MEMQEDILKLQKISFHWLFSKWKIERFLFFPLETDDVIVLDNFQTHERKIKD